MKGDYMGCEFVGAASTNYREGRGGTQPGRIIVHTTQGSFQSAVDYFNLPRPAAPSSAHYIIAKGGRIVQSVREADTAYAAPTANRDGLHIELEGDCYRPQGLFPPAQMAAAVGLAAHWCRKYGIPADRAHIKGHYEINPGYRDDPGIYFDWKGFVASVAVAAGQAHVRLWLHPDGIPATAGRSAEFGVFWPKGAHHGTVTADRKWQIWHGSALGRVRLFIHEPGERRLTLTIYDAGNREIARDDLTITVK